MNNTPKKFIINAEQGKVIIDTLLEFPAKYTMMALKIMESLPAVSDEGNAPKEKEGV